MCIHVRFEHTVLGIHLSYLGYLCKTISRFLSLDISERVEGVMALHLPIEPLLKKPLG